MKRCPECRRDYNDETLSFCLDDGTQLLDGPASGESTTSIFPSGENATAILANTTAAKSDLSSNATSGSGSGFGRAKRQKAIVGIGVLALLLVIGGGGFAFYKYGWPGQSKATSVPFQSIKIERLTSNGKATSAVISPDGKQVVYVLDDAGKRSLWLRQVATATDVQLTAPTDDVLYLALTISPDGNFLYYVYDGTTIRNRILYQMPLLGGAPKKVIEDVGSPVGLSPDGKQIAFVRTRPEESAMMIANADGSAEREIAKRPGQESFGSIFTGGVAFSPDATKIVSVANNRDPDGGYQNVIEVSIADGTQRPLTSKKFYEIRRMSLLADGSGVLVTAAEKPSDLRSLQIWYLPYSGGDARKVTSDLNSYSSISLSSDASALVAVQQDIFPSIWIAPDGDAARAEQVKSVSGKYDGFDGVAWTPDGRIVFNALTGANEAIWVMDADGKNRKRLTSEETVSFYPSVSTDGRYIVFTSERGRMRSVWRMDIDGGNPKQLMEGRGNNPQASSEWLITGGPWKMPIDGGEPVKLKENGSRCAISPDGKLLACQFDPPGSEKTIKVISVESGEALHNFDIKYDLPGRIKWAPDGRAVTYVAREGGLCDIWSQPLEGGEPKKLTDFKADQIFSFNWSRDNKLVISHGTSTSDVVLIRNIKQ